MERAPLSYWGLLAVHALRVTRISDRDSKPHFGITLQGIAQLLRWCPAAARQLLEQFAGTGCQDIGA